MATNKLPKPEKGDPPKKITTPKKPGHSGPGGSNPAGGKSIVDLANQAGAENQKGTRRTTEK